MERARVKKFCLSVSVLLLLLWLVLPVQADKPPYKSYIFDQWGDPIPTPIPYVPSGVLSGETLGVGAFNAPQDLFIAKDGSIYVVDTKNNRIVQLSPDFKVDRVITGFDGPHGRERFSNPAGIFVTDENVLYIADTDNERVVVLQPSGVLQQIITFERPEGLEISTNQFLPAKLVVDPVGRIFVAARNVYEGLMEFTADGRFSGFVGAPQVRPSFYDLFWSRFATKEQRERRALFIPIEYNNVTLDDVGFIYAVAQDGTAP